MPRPGEGAHAVPGESAQPLRVLLVTPQMHPGGAEKLIVRFSHGLTQLGHTVVVASSGGELVTELPAGVRHVELPIAQKTFAFTPWRRWALSRLIEEFQPHVVHAQSPLTALASRLAARAATHAPGTARAPQPALVTTVHGLRLHDYALARWLLPAISDAVVAVSRGTAAQLASRRPDWVHVIPVCVDLAASTQAATPVESERARLGPDQAQPFVLGAVGRLESEKGHAHLIRAFASLVEQYPNLRLHLVGDGVERPRLEQLVQRLGLVDRVAFLGYQKDVPACLANMDLFVQPSLREGMPLALLEAMANGLPVVATEVGGVPEVVTGAMPEGPGDQHTLHNPAGLLVEPGDEAALARAIAALVADPMLRRSAAAAARSRALPYSCEAMTDRYLAVYRQALAARSST